ncbi:AI-2E family transporter [Aerococcaceae bacterium NML201296]|nr:AI-2E family transporter [Aerococcaceae bacterium NML201296]
MDKLVMKYIFLIAGLVLMIVNWANVVGYMNSFMSVMMPLIVGGIMAFILNLLLVRYERLIQQKMANTKLATFSRPIGIVLSLLTIILVLLIIIGIVLPQLGSAMNEMVKAAPATIENIKQLIQKNETLFPQITELMQQLNLDWGKLVQDIVNFFNGVVSNLLGTTVTFASNIATHIINLLLSLMIAIYILAMKEQLAQQFNRLLSVAIPTKVHQRILHVLAVMSQSFESFIFGVMSEAIILGIMTTVGMMLFGFPYATMIGVLTGSLAIIPVLGAYIAGVIGAIIMLAVSPGQALLFVLFICILQQIEGNLVYPRVVGDSIGLPGIWVISSVSILGGLFGIPGMILGVPLAATVYKLIREAVIAQEQKQPLKHI